MAQGHAITKTDTARIIESSAPTDAKKYQYINDKKAIINTKGTNLLIKLSATSWIGAFELCASSTDAAILDKKLSIPIFSAITIHVPLISFVPAYTWQPSFLLTGIGSPVSMDSSISHIPSIILPSAATLLPVEISNKSPFRSWSIGIVIYVFSPFCSHIIFLTFFGFKDKSFATALPPFCFAPASINLPSKIKVIIITDVSKYVS